VIALPAARREPEVDDDLPGKREEHQHRGGVGEEAVPARKRQVRVVTNVTWLPGLLPAMTWRTMKMSRRSTTAS